MADDKKTPTPLEPTEPVRITDKREQRRLEAELAREQREAEVARSESDHPSTSPLEDDAVLEETVDDAMARVDRIQELRAKWQSGDQLTEEEQAELLRLQGEQETADKAGGEGIQAQTAFVVIIGHDGSAVASHDLNQMIYIDREATIEDMFHGAAVVVRDVTASITAKQTLFSLNVGAQAMQEKAMAVRQAQMMQGQSPGHRRRS